ncbi:MAG TPA: HIT family protein [Kiloniellales bacterium]|nr:HIT family protein [Kiloniellales bacterium]
MVEDFALDPALVKDTHQVMDWPLCRVLLMDEANYPWLILVPRRPGLRDLDELSEVVRPQASLEIATASRRLKAAVRAHKMNVAALGNVVAQLHIHVIARFRDDPAWPKPVWGQVPIRRYKPAALSERLALLRAHLPERP